MYFLLAIAGFSECLNHVQLYDFICEFETDSYSGCMICYCFMQINIFIILELPVFVFRFLLWFLLSNRNAVKYRHQR